MKKSNKKKVPPLTPQDVLLLERLDAVWRRRTTTDDDDDDDETTTKKKNSSSSSSSSRNNKKNLMSLLRDRIISNGGSTIATTKYYGTSAVTTDEDWLLSQLAQETILQELNSLYEDYTFVTAKDASLTDDLRRRQRDNIIIHEDNDEHEHEHERRRQRQRHSEDSLVYGEVDMKGFYDLLSSLDQDQNQNTTTTTTTTGYFYDLGSGSGRAVFVARFYGDYQACIGIEILPNLHQLAVSVASLYKFQYQDKLHKDCRTVQFVNSDILEYEPWWNHPPDDTVTIYIPNLLFDKALSDQIANRAVQVQPGTIVICLKQFTIPEWAEAFTLVQQRMVTMSWGVSCVYSYRRRQTER